MMSSQYRGTAEARRSLRRLPLGVFFVVFALGGAGLLLDYLLRSSPALALTGFLLGLLVLFRYVVRRFQRHT
jgi:hypothetical protein